MPILPIWTYFYDYPFADLNIAREFVRQYYTMLSVEPEHVHRFYSDESVFMRTSQHSDCPVRGQRVGRAACTMFLCTLYKP